jgi:hypothetical protein
VACQRLPSSSSYPPLLWGQGIPKFDLRTSSLELSGRAEPWRFVNAVGEKAGIWGFESGVLEGWVYPLKVFHDFSLAFQMEGSPTIYPGDQLVRAVRVRPESIDLQYSAERFTVTETLYTPRHEAGFAILLTAQTSAPLRIFVRFRPDLNLMWPGSIGGQTVNWDAQKRWMELSEPSGNFSALIGLTGGHRLDGPWDITPTLAINSPTSRSTLRSRPERCAARICAPLVTGGIRDKYQAGTMYEHILGAPSGALCPKARSIYADLDARGPQVMTPDTRGGETRPCAWSRISLIPIEEFAILYLRLRLRFPGYGFPPAPVRVRCYCLGAFGRPNVNRACIC